MPNALTMAEAYSKAEVQMKEKEYESIKGAFSVNQYELDAIFKESLARKPIANFVISKQSIKTGGLSKEMLDLVKTATCQACRGIVRMPVLVCLSCRGLICQACFEEMKMEGADQVEMEEPTAGSETEQQVPEVLCPNKYCQVFLQPARVPIEFVEILKNIKFDKCQLCAVQYNSETALDYLSYIKHLTTECTKLVIECPIGCGAEFEKSKLFAHLKSQECPEYFSYCNICLMKVQNKDRFSHKCILKMLYESSVE